MLSSVYPSSFQLLISANVLALIIVGGMGSLPGVVIGALALIGLPELLREFGEYRYLFYGAKLIVMMRLRPEGLWPSEVRRRELHASDETLALVAGGDQLPAVQREDWLWCVKDFRCSAASRSCVLRDTPLGRSSG
jgi:hypothetical protein